MMTLLLAAALTVPAVRAQDPQAAQILALALERSEVVRAQVTALESSDVLVMLATLTPASKDRALFRGQTRLMTVTSTHRILLIQLRTPGLDLVPSLAHELQHALEIAGDAGARDTTSIDALFRRIGHEHSKGFYETEEALRAERQAKEEVKR